MKQVSEELRETMEERTDFYPVATITFADGQVKEIGKDEFNLSGNAIEDSAYTSSFPLGILVSKQITLSLMNDEDQWSEYDFYGSKFFLQTKYDLDSGLTEVFNIGTFTVITPETYGTTIEVTAMDDSYKTDKDYSTGLKYPLEVGVALRDSCHTCGITLLNTTFSNDDFIIQQAPTDLTHRQFIGLCAMIAGSNARFDEYNRLVIMEYDFSAFNKPGLDGGRFDAAMPYETGDAADGGSFVPWDLGYVCDGGEFGDRADVHVLYEFKSGMTIGVDDVVITGVQLTDSDNNPHLYGKEGYVIALSNQLASGQEDKVAELIGNKLVGLRFRPFTADHICYPLADFMDLAYLIDRKQNIYQTVITDIDFQYFGFTTLKCSADSPIRNSSKYNGEVAKAIVAARKITKDGISNYDLAVQSLTSLITQSLGIFKTEEILEDGSTIFYMHNKPTLAASTTIWRMTADAFAVSTDGGKTYRAGIDAQGNAVVNVLSAVGIRFDWASGGTLTLGGNNNISGSMRILDASGRQIGKWDKDGIQATTGTFSGNLDAAGGTFKGNLQAAGGTFSGNLSAAGGSFSGTLSGANGNFSGEVNATSGTFENVTIKNNCNVAGQAITGTIQNGVNWNGSAVGSGYIAGTLSSKIFSSCATSGSLGIDGSSNYVSTTASTVLVHGVSGVTLSGGSGGYMQYVNGTLSTPNLSVAGSKNRIVKTENYGVVSLASYETPEPMFGDIGTARLDENGETYIWIDPIFLETTETDCQYRVFLTKYGAGELYVDMKNSTKDYFIVRGEPYLEFAWEIKAVQKDMMNIRFEQVEFRSTDIGNGIDYEAEADFLLKEYEGGLENV